MKVRTVCFSVVNAAGVRTPGIANGADAPDVRQRLHVEDMSQQQWSTLADAISKLRAKTLLESGTQKPIIPQKDSSGAFVDSYERFIQIHGGPSSEDGHCIHFDELIWAWHRGFLLHFEHALGATGVPGAQAITLPYWDWTEVPSGAEGYPMAYETVPGLIH